MNKEHNKLASLLKLGYEALQIVLAQIIPKCAVFIIHRHQVAGILVVQVDSTLQSYLIIITNKGENLIITLKKHLIKSNIYL